MASEAENCEEFSGRRTRSGKSSAAQAPPTPVRATRRSTRKQTQELIESDEHCIVNEEVIEDIMSEVVEEVVNTDQSENVFYAGQQDVIEEFVTTDECQVYEEPGQELPVLSEDIEMSAVPNVDEKSSSFPFGVVGQSETSEEAQNEYEEIASEEVNESGSAVENSLLASLAGDNANSLPSVGGNEEICGKKEDFNNTKIVVETQEQIQPNCEKMDSDDESLSDNAIAEDIAANGTEASDATIVNTEMVSEDELPLPTKPEINDAEEVSDEELPAPKRAELPADAEVISEDELPANATTNDNKTSNKSQKRKNENLEKNDSKSSVDGKEIISSKTKSDEQYNPMSPTGESNDATPPPEKKTKVESVKDSPHDKEKKREKDKEREKEKERKKLPDLDKYWRAVKEDPADFTGWTYLLQYVDNESDADAAREAYDAFLSHYPYCYGYWRKYADYEKRKGIKANCNAVFERGLEAIPLSVDLWIHYLAHVKSNNADNEEFIRLQFERAIEACGLEFRSDKLWDAYIKWENDAKRYHNILKIYDRLLAIPTQGYNGHFDNFQDLINQHSITSILSTEEIKRLRIEVQASSRSSTSGRSKSSHSHRSSSKEKEKDKHRDKETEKEKDKDKDKDKENKEHKEHKEHKEENQSTELSSKEAQHIDENSSITAEAVVANLEIGEKQEKALNDLSTLTEEEIGAIKDKAISIRRKLHKTTVAAVTARWTFEEGIKRPYFHVKPLERCQLKNWKDYLDFEIEKGDRKRIIVLFERCLIACALYDEFWLKMIRYLETQSHLADNLEITRDVFRRACQIHHPDKPSLHLMWAAFEECQNNFDGAAEVLTKIENRVPNLLQIAYRRINVERRRGNLVKCRELYEHYISTAKNKTIAGSLSIKYARFLNKICNNLEEGLQVLRQALEKDPANTRVALQMIDLALQRSEVNEEEVVSIMDKFMARDGIEPEQKVLFAQRKVEFLEDFGSTAKGLQDAQRALQMALSKANEAKKKRENSPSRKQAPQTNNAGFTPQPAQSSLYNNGSPATPNTAGGYNYNYYNQQNSGAAYQQQQQQSYDNYYNQWQYGSGYSGYGGQWSGYGNYY